MARAALLASAAATLLLLASLTSVASARCSSSDTVLSAAECARMCATNLDGTECGEDEFECDNVFFALQCCLRSGAPLVSQCSAENAPAQECYCSVSGLRTSGAGILGGAGVLGLVLLLCICCCCCKMCRRKRGGDSAA